MTLTLLPDTRAAIEAEIAAALERIACRARDHGRTFTELGAATRRAAEGGKRFRPALVAASFASFGGGPRDAAGLYPIAAAFELLHSAFLVHDDVIDHDTERRGALNVAGEFRALATAQGADAAGAARLANAAAVLAGDLLLHEAVRLVALADIRPDLRARVLDLLDDAVLISAAGELADVAHSVIPTDSVTAQLLVTAHDKTAVYSFTAPLCAGGLLAGANESELGALRAAGGALGLAFQLVDDLIGAFGTAEQAGRAEGGDLREAKLTPLVALARESTDWPRVAEALSHAWTGPVAMRAAQRALEASGARARLRRLIDAVLVDAVAYGDTLPAGPRDLIRSLAADVERRAP